MARSDTLYMYQTDGPIPVAARFKAWVCGRLLPGIEGSNPAGGLAVSLVIVVCFQIEVSAPG